MAHGFTVQGGMGAGGSAILHESSDHSVLVPDTELLFTAQFHRAGPDLVLTGRDGQHHLVPGYFSSEHHPALVAPNGAHLSPDTVDLLAGSPTPGHYAQAQPTAPPDAIGKIEKVVGDVSVVRNGVTVALHVGDAVFKSDVVQTGVGASCGISFPDGTALNLVANTRMALNDYAFDANSNANGALFTLVEGTFAFVAGKVAHQGDMKIATPVATMGIRGTTGVVEEQPNAPATITAQAAGHTYTFAVMPDIGTGITGMWDVYLTDANGVIQRDANGNPIVLVTVSQAGYVTYVTPQGIGQPPLVTTEPVTNSQYLREQEFLRDLFRTLNPTNLNGNGNNGSSTPPPPFQLPNPIPQLFEDSGKPFTINFTNGSNTPTPTVVDIVVGPTGPLTVVIWVASSPGKWSTGSNWLGGAQPTSPQEVEILTPIKVTADGNDSAAGLVIVTGATVNIISGATLTILDFIHGGGTIQLNSTGTDPTLAIDGAVTLVGGGTIKMVGTPGEDNILGVPGTHAFLINVDYTIEGIGTIGGGDGNLTFQNFGTVNTNDGLLTINTGNVVANNGLMEATADPLAATAGTLAIKDSVANAGTVQADGVGSAVELSGATFDNLFSVVAKNGGSITFTNVAVTNEAVSATDPAGGTINANGGTIAFDGGSIANGKLLEATNGGTLQLENLTVTNSSAATASVDATSTVDLMAAAILGGTIENAGNVVVTDGASMLHGDSVTNSGTMTVEAGASLKLEGDTTLINQAGGQINADGGTVAIELDTDSNVNSGIIKAVNGGEVDFYINVQGGSNHGLIEAGAGGTVHFFDTHGGGGGGGGQGGNYGTMEAADGGHLIFDGGLDNFYLVEAVNGGTVDLTNGAHNHAGGTILATGGGVVTIDGGLSNEATATVKADDPGSQININGFIDNFGTIQATGANALVELANGNFDNEAGGLIEADNGGTIIFDATLNGGTNTGVIEAGADGTIVINSFSGNGLFNASASPFGIGVIEAIGNNAKVELSNANITGGKLGTSGGGVFETVSGTSTLMNVILTGGTFIVDSDTILDLSGGSNGVAAYIDSTVILKGPGTVEMDFPSYSIRGGLSNGTLNNQTAIEGQGIIGTGDTPLPGVLTLINSGIIEAVGGEFVINTGTRNSATTTNSGTLEANGANAVLLIHHTNMNDAGGTIAAINGLDAVSATASVVELLDDVIVGGTLQTSNFGTIETITDHGAATTTVFDGVTNQGYVLVNDNTTLLLRDTIDNTGGKIALALTGSSDLQIDGTVTLKNGEVELNTGNDTITALAIGAKLENTANIHGRGVIGTGDGNLTLDNLSGGIINADVGTLIINTGTTVTNDGLLKAINGASLNIESAVDNTTTGTMLADGYGSYLFATDGLTNQGLVEACNSGTVILNSVSGLSNLAGGTIEAIGPISGPFSEVVISASALAGQSSIDNAGQILALQHGYVSVTGNIQPFDNYGTIKADDGQIVLQTTATLGNSDDLTNHDGGVIDALNSGVVTIGAAGVVFNLAGGLLKADGGTLALNATGGVTNDAGATMEADNGGILQFTTLTPTLDNAGTIKLNDGTLVVVGSVILPGGGSVTLDGGGTVTLSDDSGNAIKSGGAAAIFTNVDNTISGAGTIGDAHLTLHNEQHGVIDADGVNALILDTGGNTIANEGLLEATNGATLDIRSVVNNDGGTIKADGGTIDLETSTTNIGVIEAVNGGTVDIAGGILNNTATSTVEADGGTVNIDASIENYGGTIEAVGGGIVTIGENVTIDQNFGGTLEATGTGSEIEIKGGTTVKVGTIETSDGGLIEVLGGDNTFLNVVIEDGSVIKTDGGATLTLQDTTTLDGTVTLEGDGTVLLQPTNSQIAGGVGGGTLVNQTTIEGGGTIGGSGLVLDNQSSGIIDAASHLIIDTGNTVTNAGTLEATGGGTLEIEDRVDNAGGTIAAHGSGSVVELDGITVVSGTLVTDTCGVIETGAAGATLDGVTIAAGSAIEVISGTTLTLHDTTDRGGTLTVDSGSTLAIDSTNPGNVTTLDGVTVTNDGTIQIDDLPPSATLILDDDTTVSGGIVSIGSAGTLTIETGASGSGATLDNVTAHDSGAILVNSGATLTLDDGTTIDNGGESGTLTVASGSTLAIHSGGATLDGINVTDSGAIVVGDVCSGATLTLDDGTAITGGGIGTLTVTSGSTLSIESGGATLDGVSVTDSGAITVGDVDSGATLTLDDGTTISGGGVGTLTVASGSTLVIESGGATLACLTVDNCGGDITVAADTTLTLNRVTVHGGAIDGTDAAVVTSGDVVVASTIDVTGDSTFYNVDVSHGDLTVEKGATLTLDGGTVSFMTLQTDGDGLIAIGCGDSTFDNLTLASGAHVEVDSGATLTLTHTINSDGTITVDSGATLYLNNLALDGGTIKDIGTVEMTVDSTVGGGAVIDGDVGSLVIDSDHALTLDTATLENLDVTNHGALDVNIDTTLTLSKVTVHGGEIDGIDATSGDIASTIDVTGDSTFCGVHLSGGDLTVESGVTLTLSGDTVSDVAINGVNAASGDVVASTIDVTGDTTFSQVTMTDGNMTVEGGITVTLSADTLSHVTIEDGTVTSGGVIAGTIDIAADTIFDGVTLKDGNLVVDNGAKLTLSNSAVEGTTIKDYVTTSGGVVTGVIDVTNDSAIDNSVVDGGCGQLTVEDGRTLTLDDTRLENLNVTNGGTLEIDGNYTLTLAAVHIDGGTIEDYTDASGTVIGATVDVTADSAITNATIEGEGGPATSGNLGAITVELGKTLTLDGTTLEDINVTNHGTLLVEGDTTLTLDGVSIDGGTIHNYSCASGTITAGNIDITDDTTFGNLTVEKGNLTINEHTALDVADGTTVTLDGVNVTDNGDLGDASPGSGATLVLEGGTTITGSETGGLTISSGDFLQIEQGCGPNQGATFDALTVENAGTIQIDATLTIANNVSLNDGGTVSMAASGQIVGDGSHASLENVDNTIAGAGSIGGGCLTLSNDADGTILANVSAATLTLDTGANTISNAGHLEASGNGATLDIKSHVDNTGGTLLATAGGTVDVESAICGGNATIDHGTLEFGAKSDVDVTFHNSNGYGELILGDPADFSGKIFCFTGTDAGLSNSDEIFLTGVQEGDGGLTANYCGTDNITTVIIDELGGGSITLKFVGDYGADNFKLQQDANGLEIYDPPVGGAKQASSTVTTASDDHTSAPVNQIAHASDHATSLSNLFGFGGDQDSATTSHDNEIAAPGDQLALGGKSVIAPPGAPALGGGLADSLFVDGVADGSGAGGATNGDSSQSLLSSLLKTLTGGTDGTAPSIDLGSGHGQAAIAPALVTTAPSNEHVVAPTQVTSLPAASPTIASASFGAMGNDSFAFHANLGSDGPQNNLSHVNALAHDNTQIAAPSPAAPTPDVHQEFAFDVVHQDIVAFTTAVDQFHQLASNSTLLH
jgi:fibronectin-binding autotransporter adhesin